jgi:hypothetical protein
VLASDLAFLVLGLLIGIPAGIALLQVVRGRPRAAREVRLTVTPDSVPRRRSATLASDPFADGEGGVAVGGPADMEPDMGPDTGPGIEPQAVAGLGSAPTPEAAKAASARAESAAGSGREVVARSSNQGETDRTSVPIPADGRLHESESAESAGTTGDGEPVAIEVRTGADPVLAAIRRSPNRDDGDAASATPSAETEGALAAESTLTGPPRNGPPATSGIALLEAAVQARATQREAARIQATGAPTAEARTGLPGRPQFAAPRPGGLAARLVARAAAGDGSTPPATGSPSTVPPSSGSSGAPSGPAAGAAPSGPAAGAANSGPTAGAANSGPTGSGSDGTASGGGAGTPTGGGPPEPGAGQSTAVAGAPSGPCAEKRRATDELCGLATRMATQAASAVDALREAQRTYDLHQAAADEAAAIADPRAQRAAKDAAQQTFRSDRLGATSREGVEAAARTWLQEINRINQAAREASARMNAERESARTMVSVIERLSLEADAARVQAEAAAETCLNARQELADCEEAATADQRQARMPLEPSLAPDAPTSAPPPAPTPQPVGAGIAAAGTGKSTADATAEDEEADALATAAARGGGQPAILQLLAGDHSALDRLTAELAANDPAEQRRWQVQLSELVDAIVARAIEACAFDFPEEHPFWGPFTVAQDRDIALALSSLGFRFDGLGGFVDDRVPSQRDLSLATGYAGLDPMRIRHWPSESELGDLFRDVTVAGDEYLAGAAGGLTLGELVTLLGRRADSLTELWNAWGRVRPLLLEPI